MSTTCSSGRHEASETGGTPRLLAIAWLGLLTLLTYAGTLRGYFYTDDFVLLTYGLTPVREISDIAVFFQVWVNGFWRPLISFWFYLNYHLWGLDPAWWRPMNMGVHFINGLLVFRLAQVLGIRLRWGLLAASIFVVHYAHWESIVWICDITDLLSTTFVLGTLVAFDRLLQLEKQRWYLATILLFMLGLLSKENALILIALLPLYELLAVRYGRIEQIFHLAAASTRRYLPFVVLGIGYLLLVGLSIRAGIAREETPYLVLQYNIADSLFGSLKNYAGTLLWLFVPFYSGGAFYPAELSAWMGPLAPAHPAGRLLQWTLAGIAAAVCLAGFVKGSGTSRFLLLWMVAALVPNALFDTPASRFLYQASVPFAIWVGLLGSTSSATAPTERRPRWRGLLAVGMAIFIALSLIAIYRLPGPRHYIEDAETAWSVVNGLLQDVPGITPGTRLYVTGLPPTVAGGDHLIFNSILRLYYGEGVRVQAFRRSEAEAALRDRTPLLVFAYDPSTGRLRDRTDSLRAAMGTGTPADSSGELPGPWDFTGVKDRAAWGLPVPARPVPTPAILLGPEYSVLPGSVYGVEVTMRLVGEVPVKESFGKIYWITEEDRVYDEHKVLTFPVRPDGEFHTYTIRLEDALAWWIHGPIRRLRLDPLLVEGAVDLAVVRLLPAVAAGDGLRVSGGSVADVLSAGNPRAPRLPGDGR